jgi:ferrochelatase
MQAGGESYNYIPCLNDSADHIRALADLVQLHTQGWAETNPGWQALAAEKESKIIRQNAKAKGAKI